MKLVDSLHSLGSRMANLFGEPHIGVKGGSRGEFEKVDNIFSADSLSHILPYQSYDPESGIFVGRNSMGFVIETLPLVGADDATQKEVVSIFEEIMEEGSSVQCLIWADHRVSCFLDRWEFARENVGGVYRELAKRRSQFFKERSKVSPRLFRFILSYSIPSSPSKPADLRVLSDIRGRILKTLSSLTYACAWNADDFVQALDGLVNFRMDPELVKRTWRDCETLAGQIPSGGLLRVEEDHLSWSNTTTGAEAEVDFRSYRAVDYPDSWSISAMQRLIGDLYRDHFRLSDPFIIHYGVHCPSQEAAESQFRRRMHLVENQGKSYALQRLIPDLADELKELEFVRGNINQHNRFVWTQLGVGIWSQKGTIHKSEQALKTLFRINNFSLAKNTCVHFPQFLSFLPMTWGEYVEDLKKLNLLKTTISSECGNLIPIQGEWVGTPSPGMLLIGRRGQLMNWNPFDNQSGNYNVVVVGRSGSGKSVFMQELLMTSLGVGSRVYVLEVGRSFEKTCSIVQGQYIEFARNTALCLNPFTHISKDPEERDQAFSMLKSIISSMAAPVDGTDDYQNGLIENAICFAWKEKGNKATVTDVASWLQEHKEDRARTLGVMLTPYAEGGVHARYFEGENNVDFTCPFVLIELEELKEKKDLQSVVLQMFIMTITNLTFLGDRKKPFHICIDEAWDLLRGKQTGGFIETLARRLRKYNGSLVIGTQSVDDFYSTPGSLAAFENSDWMCMLAQNKSSIQRFAESKRVDMDEGKQVALESVTTRHGEYSEVMICDAEGNYSIGRLVLDPFSNLLYSTKADEYSKIKELQGQGFSVAESIDKILGIGGRDAR